MSPDRGTPLSMPQPGLTVITAGRTWHAASTPLSLAMLHWAQRIRADLVHLHFPYPPGDLAALAAAGRPPLVLTYHSDIVRQRVLLRAYRPLMALTLRRAGCIIATSPQYVASSPFLRPHAAKCRIVPLGVDTERFHPAGSSHAGPPRILFVGRLRYYKGLHVLIDAMAQLTGPAELWIAGEGPEHERLAAQAQAAGIAGRIRFLGDISDTALPELYRSVDLFVLPAHLRAEAFGIALTEALASGLACISTELGTGTSFVNLDHVTGRVVPPADPAALAQAIDNVLADTKLRRQYGRAARARSIAHFSRHTMLDGIEQIYRDLR
ncbi:MAG TPA: glycosyltransferase [Roseiflexaceae bacterium]|nr:glycosyltransferase [Roseiflexaceae bacterium]